MEEIHQASLYLIYLRLLRSPYFLFACLKHVQPDLIGMQILARANPALNLKHARQGIIGIPMHVPVRKFLNSLDEKQDIQYRENIGKSSR
jgi:hypothetical protein